MNLKQTVSVHVMNPSYQSEGINTPFSFRHPTHIAAIIGINKYTHCAYCPLLGSRDLSFPGTRNTSHPSYSQTTAPSPLPSKPHTPTVQPSPTLTMTTDPHPPTLLTLPYDIRYQIYTHLFPPGRQIYIQAFPSSTSPSSLRSITTSPIPTPLLSTCRLLHLEAGEYLYNTYLFNLVGRKPDCLAKYKLLERTMQKYTGMGVVHVDAFSNGEHSSTMAIALHAGEGKVEILRARGRGEEKTIGEVEREVGRSEVVKRRRRERGMWGLFGDREACVMAVGWGMVVAFVGWLCWRLM